MLNKIMPVSQAAELIRDGDTIAISSAGLVGYPDYIVNELEQRYLRDGAPGNLTLIAGCGHGQKKRHAGSDRFGHPGFLKRFIGSHPDVTNSVRTLIEQNEIEGYVLPQGIIQQLYRCSAARQPGLLSKIGIGTYIDPRYEGGKLNSVSRDDMVRVMEIDGDEYLYYKSTPVNAAILRGTTADESGNITIEKEALKLEILEIALAAKASNGKVIAQVERVAANGSLNAKNVVVPGELVDAVVVCGKPEFHMQTAGTQYNPFMSGELRGPVESASKSKPALAPDDIICRRAVFELRPETVVNVGIGIGAGVGPAAAVEGIESKIAFTLELGVFGGTPQPRPDFGASINPNAFISHTSMFDFYHGGGLDITFLGAAQIAPDGSVNVSKFDGRAAGQGGFIDISQTSKKVVFCNYFTAKGFSAQVDSGGLHIIEDGSVPKFVDRLEQVTFNGKLAAENGQEVIYITERAVFRLTPDGIMLTEIAPGVELEKDILSTMGFRPLISGSLKLMDARIFTPGTMNCFDI